MRLDLQAKRLGLVPQAQKIDVRTITDIDKELKTIPSNVLAAAGSRRPSHLSASYVKKLERLIRGSIDKKRHGIYVSDEMRFKFGLNRLPARRRILRLITPLFHSRPDLSSVLSNFAVGFRCDPETAKILYNAVKLDPVFDATAGDYVTALDVCVPIPEPKRFKVGLSKLRSRSIEKSLLLHVPLHLYLYKRSKKSDVLKSLENETSPIAASQLIHMLAFDVRHAALTAIELKDVIRKFATRSPDEDLARYCTYLMMAELKTIPAAARTSGALLIRQLGVHTPPKGSLLRAFFRNLFRVAIEPNWEAVLGRAAHSEAQRRSVLIQAQWNANPSVLITVLDNFNDLLIQRFSRKHKLIKFAFKKAAGKYSVPDYGSWARHPSLNKILPKACPILIDCHNLRLRAEIAHSTLKKTGKFTRPISYREKEVIAKRLQIAYSELVAEFHRL